ncbi:MAG: class I adenylate-forming enzyme family protein [Planctomycetota bacterium]|jgi:long-chain acyl-CoA synthetase
MKIIDLLTDSAASQPQATAITSREIEVSYKQMLEDVRSLSEQLRCAGCSRGAKVAIVLNNSAEYLISFFAISGAGGIILPLSTRMTPYEVARYVDRADVSIVITSRAYRSRLCAELGDSNKITTVNVSYSVHKNLEIDTSSCHCSKVDERNRDVALMVPTSGTTGAPKMVLLTDDNLISNMAVYRLLMGFSSRNIVYCSLSFRHIYCICAQILTHISLGDTFVISDKPFLIKDFLRVVEADNITITAFVPYMAILLAEFPQPQAYNLESLKTVTLSGAKTPKSTYKMLTEKYHWVQFVNTYGMSEAGSRISIAAPFANRFPADSVGRPMPGVMVRIMDEKGNSVGPNRVGEIVVRSSGIMKGYYKQPDLTAEAVANGWLRTGDLGKRDEDGNLFILGRLKEVIVTGGENVCPLEIEECLSEHPGIREAAVVGQSDRLLQEVPCAFVVRNNHADQPAEVDVIKFCRARLSSYKVPRSVRFVESIPKLGTSKIDRSALKKMTDNGSLILFGKCQ